MISPRSFKGKLNLPSANYNDIYRSIIQLIPNDWMYILKSKTSQESLLKVFYYNNRGIKKVKTCRNFRTKSFTLLSKIITRTITKLSNSLHGQIPSKITLFSPPQNGTKSLLTGLKSVPIAITFPFGTNLFTFPYL